MASISGLVSLPPQIKIKGEQLVIEKGIVNSKGKAYDITINFRSADKEAPPPSGQLLRESLVKDIQGHAQRILESLQVNGIDTEHLERLGFRVRKDADGNPKTEILTSAVKPIFESLRNGDSGDFQIQNGNDFPMNSEGSAPDDLVQRSKTVHEELLSLRRLFRAEYFMVLPTPQNSDEEEILPSKRKSSLPDVSLSFQESVTPLSKPRPVRSRSPGYLLFALEGSDEKKREKLSLLRAAWNEFLDDHDDFKGIAVEQLLGFKKIEESGEDLLRNLFRNEKMKSSLYKKFQEKAPELCESSFGTQPSVLLKHRLLDALDGKWQNS